jgi:hypothetical protein
MPIEVGVMLKRPMSLMPIKQIFFSLSFWSDFTSSHIIRVCIPQIIILNIKALPDQGFKANIRNLKDACSLVDPLMKIFLTWRPTSASIISLTVTLWSIALAKYPI